MIATINETVSLGSYILMAMVGLVGGGGFLGWRHSRRSNYARDVLRNERLDELIKHNGDLRSDVQDLRNALQHVNDVGSANLNLHMKEMRDEFRELWRSIRHLERAAHLRPPARRTDNDDSI